MKNNFTLPNFQTSPEIIDPEIAQAMRHVFRMNRRSMSPSPMVLNKVRQFAATYEARPSKHLGMIESLIN